MAGGSRKGPGNPFGPPMGQPSLFDVPVADARKGGLGSWDDDDDLEKDVDDLDEIPPHLLKLLEDGEDGLFPVGQIPEPVPQGPRVFTVSDLGLDIKDTLADHFGEILVQGEIADFKGIHRNGHLYFALKDAKSQVRAVMWKGSLMKVPFEIKGGLEVIVTGKLDFYSGSGSLQIVAERMEPVGVGALQLKFEQLKEKLKNEGLFDALRKRKVQPVNWRIGIVTSTTTAALQDMLRIYRSRFPLAELFVFHAAVQGEKAPTELVAALKRANRFSESGPKPLDVIVVGRGGGSYEDLFCFNDEGLARAIAASKVPTVSAVGHEIDYTIADMVSDKRAATPSHAAQETVPEVRLWTERLQDLERIFERRMTQLLNDQKMRIDTAYNRLVAAAPQRRLQMQRELLTSHERRLGMLMTNALQRRKSEIARASQVLDALSPLKVLERGYSVVLNTEGRAVRSVADTQSGQEVALKLKDGQVKARVL